MALFALRGDSMNKTGLDWVALVLVIVGALNWGLIGLFGFDFVAVVLGSVAWLQTLVYVLVGVSGLYMLYFVSK